MFEKLFIAYLQKNAPVHTLSLSGCEIGDAGATEIAGALKVRVCFFSHNLLSAQCLLRKTLRTLILRDSHSSGATNAIAAALAANTSLQELRLFVQGAADAYPFGKAIQVRATPRFADFF